MKALVKAILPDSGVEFLRETMMRGRRLLRRRGRITLADGVSCRLLGAAGDETFFGYYDISPFEERGERLLACRLPSGNPDLPLELGTFDLAAREPRFQEFASTSAWCWQQSCRLRWMPSAGTGHVMFNNLGEQGFESVLLDIERDNVVQRFSKPFYDVDPMGQSAVTLNFQRLERLRPGYGYANLPDPSGSSTAPEDDGVWFVDLASDESRLLHSLAELAAFEPQNSMTAATHYINHIAWNPSGTRFLFFHIWVPPGQNRCVRLMTSDAEGTLRAVTNERHVSHYCWLDDTRMMLYATIGGVEGYLQLSDTAAGGEDAVLNPSMPREDGHPSWNTACGRLLFDTLPDRVSERTLRTYRPGDAAAKLQAAFYSPPVPSRDLRCDLHPRWRSDGRAAALDTTLNGHRQIAILSGF